MRFDNYAWSVADADLQISESTIAQTPAPILGNFGNMADNPSTSVDAVVEKIIKVPGAPEKAQLIVEAGDDLYRELRIENTVIDDKGEEVSLKPGAEVEVTIEAQDKDTTQRS